MNFILFLKRFFIAICFMNFTGCSFLLKSQEVINMDRYKRIVSGGFKNIDDVISFFPKSEQDVDARVSFIIDETKSDLKKIFSLSSKNRDFENTIAALDKLEARFGACANAIEIFEMVSPDEKMIKSCHDAAVKLRNFAVDAFLNKDLYKAFKEYVDGNMKNEKLNKEEVYFIDESMKDFKRQGFDLPEKDFLKVKELKKELSKLGLEFESNINTDKSFIEVEKTALDGLSDEFINALEKSDSGKYVLKCDYPTYFEVIEHCKISQTRKDFYFVFSNRAYDKNLEILNSIIKKRDQLARVVGFESYAALDLDDEMVKTPKRAKEFLTDLVEKTMKKADKEFTSLKEDLPSDVQLDNQNCMNPWDYKYSLERYKKKHFDIDERKIAEYFPVENTLKEVFNIYQNFLGLEFKPIQSDGLWHTDVKLIEIYNKENQEKIGTLFLDLYPRENKYSHACMAEVIATTKKTDKNADGKEKTVPAVIVVIANFPKATKDKPALLKYDDVKTFFHEFGHAMHGFLGRTEMASFSGTNVKRDFVEMPSQMFEEWMWDKNILSKVSKHYKTHESLPEEVINNVISLKTFDSGYFVTRQVWLSLISLNYFLEGENKDTDDIRKALHEKYIKHIRFEPEAHFQTSFGHLVGYGAKYYGYMWSKVFSLDMFDKVKKAGLLNREMGKKLVDDVLGKGGSVDPDILLENFLGRKPSQNAFLKEYGII